MGGFRGHLGNSLTKRGAGHELFLFFKMGGQWRIVDDEKMRFAGCRKAEGLEPVARSSDKGGESNSEKGFIEIPIRKGACKCNTLGCSHSTSCLCSFSDQDIVGVAEKTWTACAVHSASA